MELNSTLHYGGWDMHSNISNALKSKVAPIDKPITTISDPSHFPKMKPESNATGEPKPSNKTHMTTNKKNKDNKAK